MYLRSAIDSAVDLAVDSAIDSARPKEKKGLICAHLTKIQLNGWRAERVMLDYGYGLGASKEAITEYRVLGPTIIERTNDHYWNPFILTITTASRLCQNKSIITRVALVLCPIRIL
nr:RNA pseudouridine synthase 3, mitochondrial isoform X1 [Tanacetum cinerariifolium]